MQRSPPSSRISGAPPANTVAAGFDGGDHSSNGYLIHQFLAACSSTLLMTNTAAASNRARFLFEVLDAVGQALPFRVGFRLSPMMNRFTASWSMPAPCLPSSMWCVVRMRRGLAYLHLHRAYLPDQLAGGVGVIEEVARHFSPLATMPLVSNGGIDPARRGPATCRTPLRCGGLRPAVHLNPDLPQRVASGAALAKWNPDTFYQGGEAGYIDYPPLG